MIDCQKAQKEQYQGRAQHRCLHAQAETFKQIVSEEVCEACPLRIARKKPVQNTLEVGKLYYIESIPSPENGGQVWLENGEYVEKMGDGSKFLLGDWVETNLTRLGITKEKWVEIKAGVGLAPTCSCEQRQEWLNQVGTRFGEAMRNTFTKLWS